MKTKTLAMLAATTALALPAAAQPAFEIDEIVISANLEDTEAARTGATISVISLAALKKTAETKLAQLLARLPGVASLARGPLGAQTGLTVRGVSQNYIKVLVDGIDISDPSGPQVAYDFGRMTTLGLGRVELLRGSQSALYGSQAVGGVLSLSSARPDEDGTHQDIALEMGSYDTLSAAYSYGLRDGGNELALTLSHVRTDGFSAADEDAGNTEADGYRASRLSVTGATVLDNGVRLGFAAFAEDADGEFDEQDFSTSPATPVDGSPGDELTSAISRGARVFAEFTTGAVEHTLAATYFAIDRRLTGVDFFGTSNLNFEGRRAGLSWKAAADLGQGRLVFGADSTRERYFESSDYGFGPDSSSGASTLSGVYGEYTWQPSDALDVTATARYDSHSQFGEFVTGRLAAAWRPGADLTFRLSAANGFRAPSGYELYGPYGDPTLQPEESRSLDLGVEKRFGGDAFVKATLFWIETDNLIDYFYPNYTQIAGMTVRRGIEVEGQAALSDRIAVTAAYTLTDAANPVLSPGSTWNSSFGRHQLALGLDAELSDRLSAAVTLVHVADRQTLPDYTVANATVTYDLGRDTEAYLRIENLTNEDYQLWPGYGTSDRAFYVGLRRSF